MPARGHVAAHQARRRAPGERGNAQLNARHILRKLRCCPWRAGSWRRPSTSFKTREIGG